MAVTDLICCSQSPELCQLIEASNYQRSGEDVCARSVKTLTQISKSWFEGLKISEYVRNEMSPIQSRYETPARVSDSDLNRKLRHHRMMWKRKKGE